MNNLRITKLTANIVKTRLMDHVSGTRLTGLTKFDTCPGGGWSAGTSQELISGGDEPDIMGRGWDVPQETINEGS